ncbi:MAG: bifunctional phosphoribosylaminoimidazolecarboxamide formyltransferase/IMP cyclohydrolase [Clostridia bacterium]|jgi:phosphoribosylaminoimidazolecarboxamide formyltransferase/IMP cyclohydrolase|nr:bifunctional phosphoribosylaminoimidazolecarboxamide formyltransferase/IMP cyclohydrolase [Clostridia bacterium]
MSRLALLSVSDKNGIVEFAGSLTELGFSIISTGGTAQALKEAGIAATPVSELTGFPEILEGRVKTLHPKIHAGILAKGNAAHLEQLAKLQIEPIELVVVNLYPFQETVARRGVLLAEAIENIDIGGPSMLRSAAKNYQRVTVVVNPDSYGEIIAQLQKNGNIDERTRFQLALEAFTHTAEYDMAISTYLSRDIRGEEFPNVWFLSGTKKQELRYGENPHQKAAFYGAPQDAPGSLAGAEQLQGKELSYNNLVDLQAAWSVVQDFTTPAATIIKHTNPCGTALGGDILEAYMRAYAADSISAFGGIIGLNKTVDAKTAREISKTFMEAVIAPGFSPEALTLLADKKNLRLLAMGEKPGLEQQYWIEPLSGGFLVQQWDKELIKSEDLKVVSNKQPDSELMKELLFAWKVVKHVKSNAIVISKNKQTLGVGAGQMNRVGAARIALEQAGNQARGAVLASDAYFPFSDTVELAAKQGIKAVIQPGGSIRDEDTIQKANEYGLIMVFTGVRHFKH